MCLLLCLLPCCYRRLRKCIMQLLLLLFNRNRIQLQRLQLANVADRRSRTDLRALCSVVHKMQRDTATRGWSPGDPVVFSPSSTMSTTARQPLGALKQTQVKREEPARSRHHQTTLSPWAKAAWQPGMRVLIGGSSKQSTSSTMIEEEEHHVRMKHRTLKGKQRSLEGEDSELHRYARCHLAR